MLRLLIVFSLVLFSFSGFSQDKVKWYTIEEAAQLNKKEPKKMLIDVYTDWCGWCKVMDKNTYSQKEIADYLNKNFYPVKLNAEDKEDITFMGKTYKYVPSGSRGYNELAAALLKGKLAYPSIVFMDEQGRPFEPIQGYVKAAQFDPILKFVGGNHYLKESFQDFQASYTSPIKEDTAEQ